MDAFHRGIALLGGLAAMVLGATCLEASPEFLAQSLPGGNTPLWLVALSGVVFGLILALSAILAPKPTRTRR